MTTSAPALAGQNPVTVPLYTFWDVARYLRVPAWSVLLMTGRVHGWPHPEEWFLHYGRRRMLVPLADDIGSPDRADFSTRVSFSRLADMFVLSAAFHLSDDRTDRDPERRSHAVWHGLERAAGGAVFEVGEQPDGRLDRLASWFGVSGEESAFLRKWLTIHLDRVEVMDGVSARLFPFTRDPAEGSPRVVVLDPRIRFGRPTLVGRGLPTDSVFGRYKAGDSAAALADDYDVPLAEIEEAIRYESLPRSPLIPILDW